MKKYWPFSVDWSWTFSEQSFMHFVNLLTVLLCNDGFSRIKKTTDYQTIIITWSCNFGLRKYQRATLSVADSHKQYTFHRKPQCDQEMGLFCCAKQDNKKFQNDDFFDFRSVLEVLQKWFRWWTFNSSASRVIVYVCGFSSTNLLNSSLSTMTTTIIFKASISIYEFFKPTHIGAVLTKSLDYITLCPQSQSIIN